MRFYKRDPDRALAGMIELNMKQRGAYNSLLDLLYSRDGSIALSFNQIVWPTMGASSAVVSVKSDKRSSG